MAKIKLSDGFRPIPEGTYVLKITKVNYKEDFGKLEITLSTQDGKTTMERYSLMRANGEMNDGACAAFSYMARVALNDMDVEEIDPADLVGCFIKATVVHEEVESNKNPGKMITFTKLSDKEPSPGWDEVPEQKSPAYDLSDIL